MPIFGKGSSGGIFMYDITKHSSLLNVKDWLNAFKQGLSNDKKKKPDSNGWRKVGSPRNKNNLKKRQKNSKKVQIH